MSIETRKLSLIQRLMLIQKESLLDKIEALLNKEAHSEIPQWQKDEVNRRLKKLQENTDTAIDLDETVNRMQKKHGL
ncbi:MAG: addiction module protein [Crocinitomicaceae bacterium]